MDTPRKNILVFPCGSEIGLEIHRSLKHNLHFKLLGGSSLSDHGRFVYEDYVGNIPFHDTPGFLDAIRDIASAHRIDAIYPTMDLVAATLKGLEPAIGTKVIGSSKATSDICASKSRMYAALKDVVPIPRWSATRDRETVYPVFIKPDVGYGARNVYLARDEAAASSFVESQKAGSRFVFCDHLPGPEYTIDCFSDRHQRLLFAGARERVRVVNGISVNTRPSAKHADFFQACAEKINLALQPRGAWFFQMKEDGGAQPHLLEVAARLGGSSALFRAQGINFALLSIYDAFDMDVRLLINDCDAELDRALSNRYRIDVEYEAVYVDYDDCLIVDGKVNPELLAFVFQALNNRKTVRLITKHAGNLAESLQCHRLSSVFDEVIHLRPDQRKSDHIRPHRAIFIDDSFAERSEVKARHGIPVFSLDMVPMLT